MHFSTNYSHELASAVAASIRACASADSPPTVGAFEFIAIVLVAVMIGAICVAPYLTADNMPSDENSFKSASSSGKSENDSFKSTSRLLERDGDSFKSQS